MNHYATTVSPADVADPNDLLGEPLAAHTAGPVACQCSASQGADG